MSWIHSPHNLLQVDRPDPDPQHVWSSPHLILPLEFCPHAAELCLRAAGGHNVIHDINVDVVENDNIPVAAGPQDVVDNVSEDDAILRGGNLHVGLDVRKVVWRQNNWLK